MAQLRGDWTSLGETRAEVPVDDLATLLGTPGAQALNAQLSLQLSSPGSWVFYARRLKERVEAWSDVLVQSKPDGVVASEGTVSDLTEKLGGLSLKGAGDTGRLLAFAQHLTRDLRIPLRQIHDCLGLVRSSLGDSEEAGKWLLYAETSVARARAVVGDAFELLQVLGGTTPPHLEAVPLSVLVPALSRLHLPAATAAEQKMDISVVGEPYALVDFAGLSVVIDNLVSNAVRHTGPGTTIRVVGAVDASGAPTITVADDGNMLSDQGLSRLFEPFFRANTNTVGSGLGLVLVLELCRVMQASVLMRRNEAGGLTAEVRLQPAPTSRNNRFELHKA